ncbi:hypothetical protein [Pelagibacterium montanilacus]|uniref:hypothetical protein n=1 Tax=Pelagibacterium montanilacus TaxID=2185280 RepID=UPI000F8C5E67|nr:hypothetical protein [Pelagibacterium montanilacus]
MSEFEYKGYRIRTVYEDKWRIRIWPPVTPRTLVDQVVASRSEGAEACRMRACALVDRIDRAPGAGASGARH